MGQITVFLGPERRRRRNGEERLRILTEAAKASRGKRRLIVLPRYSALDALLGELRSRRRAEGVDTILVNSFGQAWCGDGFGGSFNRVRDKADNHYMDPECVFQKFWTAVSQNRGQAFR